ncbi:hypothetical protein MCOR31_012058, partial [Pyricularia oryzae]
VPATYHLMKEDLRKMMTIIQRLKEDKEEAKQEVSIANSEAWGIQDQLDRVIAVAHENKKLEKTEAEELEEEVIQVHGSDIEEEVVVYNL